MVRDLDKQRKIKVVVVDDSAFFRHHIAKLLAADDRIEVIGSAGDGISGVQAVHNLRPDVVTMDVEMPVMDGISAVKKIMAERPTPIIMLSSYTSDGAKATLDALNSGAVDFISKQSSSDVSAADYLSNTLVSKVLAVGNKAVKHNGTTEVEDRSPAPSVVPRPRPSKIKTKNDYKVVVIGASTGGPVAIQRVISSLPASFSVPVLLVVHMPGNFTTAFAERLNGMCSLEVSEAKDGDRLKPGHVLLAPGGMQISFLKKGGDTVVSVREGTAKDTYKPCIDKTFESASQVFQDSVLAIVLTGMGSDGAEGARKLKQLNATVWSQDEDSCVIYGMPQAVERNGLSDMVLSLDEIGPALIKAV